MLLDPPRRSQATPSAPATGARLRRSTARDGRRNRLEFWALTHGAPVWQELQRHPATERFVNRKLIDKAVSKAPPRPYRLSTMSPYTSWDSLTDKSHNARQLPPAPGGVRTDPPARQVAALFARDGEMTPCPKSTVLFAYFAQWFTDGFLRTKRPDDSKAFRDIKSNVSNHEVDLTQLYGSTPAITKMLRAHRGGRLKSVFVGEEEYPPLLCDSAGAVKPEFAALPVVGLSSLPAERRRELLAMGSDVANAQVGYAMFNVLFLREHNRIARELTEAHPSWDDDRLFATTRNILTVLLIRLAIEEYINHIAPYHFKFRLQPESFHGSAWYRPNWESVEFNLLYRWHSLIPTTLRVGGEDLPILQTTFRNDLLTRHGLAALFAEASDQRAGKVSLLNTDGWFADKTSYPSVLQSRQVELASYNDYRELVGLPRVTHVDQISSDARIREALTRTYGDVDKIEFYVGLFAEDNRSNSALPPLMGSLVGLHAFSQLMTNPLLAPNVYVEATFSPLGWKMLHAPLTLEGMLQRNLPPGAPPCRARLTREGWTRE